MLNCSFRWFCGFRLEATLPDATTILRFCNFLHGQNKKLLQMVNDELVAKGMIWSGGSPLWMQQWLSQPKLRLQEKSKTLLILK